MTTTDNPGTRNLGAPFALVNHATHVTDAQVAAIAAACTVQLRRHVAPAWARLPVVVAPQAPGALPSADAGQVVLLDNPDQAGALGYHDVDPQGHAYARVFVEPVLQNGGNVLDAQRLSVASVVSHEVAEWFVDPDCQLWADTGSTVQVAYEVGDPVEADSYPVTVTVVGHTQYVTVSNFVFPEWFNPVPPAGCRYDHMGTVHGPFAMSKGGYMIVRNLANGKVGQEFGHGGVAGWRQATKEAYGSRTGRRMGLGPYKP